MTVECPGCSSTFPVDPKKVPQGGVHARCSVCGEVFFVEVPQEDMPSAPVELEQPTQAEEVMEESVSDSGETGVWEEESSDLLPEADTSFQAPVEGEPQAFDPPSGEPQTFEAQEMVESPPVEAETFEAPPEQEREAESPSTEATPAFDAPVEEDAPSLPDDSRAPAEEDGFVTAEGPGLGASDLDLAIPESDTDASLETGPTFGEGEVTFDLEAGPLSEGEGAFSPAEEEPAPEPETQAPPAPSFDPPPAEATFEAPSTHEPEPPVEPAFEAPAPGSTYETPPAPETPFLQEPATEPAATPEPPPPTAPLPTPSFGKRDPKEKAQRLARVLVSDIILYNPDRHQRALEGGTLKEEFDDEIQKSWNEYVEQVGDEIANSTDFFNEALNEILAKGQRVF